VTPKRIRNLSASVAARLLERARRTGEDYQAPGERILSVLRAFLLPILDDLRRGTPTSRKWPPGGPWR